MTTQIESLSSWIESFSINDVPVHTLEQARLQVLDCISSITAGSRSAVGQKIYVALKSLSSDNGDHRIFPSGEKWPLENAVYLHAALINALEWTTLVTWGI
ncbi:MAG: MmgE/PrpD family protein [Chryseolinea sp.]